MKRIRQDETGAMSLPPLSRWQQAMREVHAVYEKSWCSKLPGDFGGGFLRRHDWEHLKVNDVVPVRDPLIQQISVICFHELETAMKFLVHPTRNVAQSFWGEPSSFSESAIDW